MRWSLNFVCVLLVLGVWVQFVESQNEAVRTLIQWGQSPLRSEERLTNSITAKMAGMQKPDFINLGVMPTQNISFFASTAPLTMLVTPDHEVWASGMPQKDLTMRSYQLSKLNFSGCPGGTLGSWDSVVGVGSLGGSMLPSSSSYWVAIQHPDSTYAWFQFPDGDACASMKSFPSPDPYIPIKTLFCTLSLCSSLTDDGKLFLWGYGATSVMYGPGGTTSLVPKHIDTAPWGITDSDVYNFTLVAISLVSVHAITNHSGTNSGLVSWGNPTVDDNPCANSACFTDIGFTVTDIAAGTYHVLLLRENGDVYAFGANSVGQLGLPPSVTTSQNTPTQVSFEVGVIVVGVGAYLRSSFAITQTGDIYAWGCNTHNYNVPGMLGVGDFVSFFSPDRRRVLLPRPGEVIPISILSAPSCPHNGGCTVSVLVETPQYLLDSPDPSPDADIMSDPQTPEYLLEQSVVLSWGGQILNGNKQVYFRGDGELISSGPSVVELPRNRSYHSLSFSRGAAYVMDSENDVWGWGDPVLFPPYIASYQAIPLSLTSVTQPNPRPVAHFAGGYRTSLWMYEGAYELTRYVAAAGITPPTTEAIAVDFNAAQVREITAGSSHFAVWLLNGTVYTIVDQSISPPFYFLGHTDTSPEGSLTPIQNIELLAACPLFTVIYYRETSASEPKLAAFGSVTAAVLGNQIIGNTYNPVDVNITNVEGSFYHPVRGITCGTSTTLVLDESGAIFGFGDRISGNMAVVLGPNRDQAYGQMALVQDRNAFGGSRVVEISIYSKEIALALTFRGDVYGWGLYTNTFLYPFGYIDTGDLLPHHLPINEVGGVKYAIRSLPRALIDYSINQPPIVVIATPLHPSNPPADREWYSWGHKGWEPGLSNFWGQIDMMPVYSAPKPIYRTHYSDKVLPFRADTSSIAIAEKKVFALDHDTQIVYDLSKQPVFGAFAVPDMPPVVAMASAGDSLWFISDGMVGCYTWATQTLQSLCQTPGIGLGPLFDIGSDVSGTATDVQCSSVACTVRVVLPNNTWRLYHYGRYFNSTHKISLYGPMSEPDTFDTSNVEDHRLTSLRTQDDNSDYVYHLFERGAADACNFLSIPRLLSGGFSMHTTVYSGTFYAAPNWSCGAHHCLLLNEQRVLHGWGSNREGQLSSGSEDYFNVAIEVHPGAIAGTISRAAGVNRASIVLTEAGNLYSWGVDAANADSYLVDLPSRDQFESIPYTVTTTPRFVTSNSNVRRLVSYNAVAGSSNYDFIGFMGVDATRSFEPYAPISETPEPIWQAPSAPAAPATPAAPQPPASTAATCSGSLPSPNASCQIRNGQWTWVVTGSFNVTSASPSVTVTNSMIIEGDLTVDAPGFTISPNDNGDFPFINVAGRATFNQPMTLRLSTNQQKRLDDADDTTPKRILQSESKLPQDLNQVLTVDPEKNCRKVHSDLTQDTQEQRTTLNVAFKIKSGSCNNWWIIVVSVLVPIVVIVAVVIIIYKTVPSFRYMVRPYKGAN